MAERRMFAKAVIGSGKFLRMPATARLLYYDLGMEADDDGVVEAFRVMRTTGATDDDLKILCAKGFVRILNEELVAQICDWKVNNYIQKDRYRPSVYTALLEARADSDQHVYSMDTTCIQNVSEVYPQVSIGKESKGEDSIGEGIVAATAAETRAKKKKFVPPSVEEVAAYCDENGYGTINPEAFVDYYEANGWKVGSQAMKDWRATVRNWARRDEQRGTVSGGYQRREESGDPFLRVLNEEFAKEMAKNEQSGNNGRAENPANGLSGILFSTTG